MKTLMKQAREMKIKELRHHAEVSTRNNCGCGQCFCCAAAAVVKERYQKYADNKYRFPAPPVVHKAWTATAWVEYIDEHGEWLD